MNHASAEGKIAFPIREVRVRLTSHARDERLRADGPAAGDMAARVDGFVRGAVRCGLVAGGWPEERVGGKCNAECGGEDATVVVWSSWPSPSSDPRPDLAHPAPTVVLPVYSHSQSSAAAHRPTSFSCSRDSHGEEGSCAKGDGCRPPLCRTPKDHARPVRVTEHKARRLIGTSGSTHPPPRSSGRPPSSSGHCRVPVCLSPRIAVVRVAFLPLGSRLIVSLHSVRPPRMRIPFPQPGPRLCIFSRLGLRHYASTHSRVNVPTLGEQSVPTSLFM